jgi:hypothetical protein
LPSYFVSTSETHAVEQPKDKNKRKVKTVQEHEQLDKLDREMTTAVVGCCYGVNKSIKSFTKKNEDKIGGSFTVNALLGEKLSHVICHGTFLELRERTSCA